jgi:hypothetical protein
MPQPTVGDPSLSDAYAILESQAGLPRSLLNTIRKQLREVVEGYTGRCDEAAARAGIEWMRDKYRARGAPPRFLSFHIK